MTTNTSHTPKDSLVPFFIITYAITWGIGAVAIFLPEQFRALFGELSDQHPLYYVAVAAPTISATILSLAREGWSGLGALYSRLIRWRFGIRWYLLALVGIPALGWLASQVTGPKPLKDISTPALLLTLLINLLITGPLGEELGWRGFALPHLLKKFNPFAASLILGIIWGVWHLPAFYVSSMVQSSLSLPIFLLSALCLSFLATWLVVKSAGSVLIAVILHYTTNFSVSVLGANPLVFAALLLALVILALALDKEMNWFKKH